jgi:hypothetical protein
VGSLTSQPYGPPLPVTGISLPLPFIGMGTYLQGPASPGPTVHTLSSRSCRRKIVFYEYAINLYIYMASKVSVQLLIL